MALAEILETIRSEAEATASSILDEAQAEADALIESARSEAEVEERRFANTFDPRIKLERARVLSRGHLDVARKRRAAREDLYSRAIEAVAARLADERSADSYGESLGSLLDEALRAMPDATTVRVDPADSSVVEEIVRSMDLEIEIELEETPLGGLVLSGPGRTVDNTLATRLARADNRLRLIAGEIIPELRGGGSE